MLGIRSFRSKLQAAFVLLGLAAIAVTGWEASQGAGTALREATYDRLNAIAETKRRTLERYFEDVGNHVLALSSDESTIAALEALREAWDTVPPTMADPALDEFYRAFFATLPGYEASHWMPQDPRTRTLQHAFLVANPHAPGSRQQLLTAPGTGKYAAVHARYHPTLHRYQSAFGFYDIFVIDAATGRILYSVLKEIDIGSQLTIQPYSATTLAKAFTRALEVDDPETFVVEDYQPYVASSFAPAAFYAAPIWRRGVKTGVLAIQISVDHLNRVMTSSRNWRDEGLGETGQSYIVGPDNTLRSDVRFELEKPGAFHDAMLRAGVDPASVERIRRHRTAILNLRVSQELASRIQRGERGTHSGRDLRNVEVLRSIIPLNIPGFRWTLIAEIESAEALEPIKALRMNIFGWAVAIALLFFAAAALLARSVTRPVQVAAEHAGRVGRLDFEARIPVVSDDEIGQLATAFNNMAEDLRRTTVSKEELEKLAGRLISAQEEERSRIGRELHDDLTQRLAALAIEVGRLERQTSSPTLASVKQQIIRLSQDVHDLSRRLHPAMLEDLGLVAALESEYRKFLERGGPPVHFETQGDMHTAPMDVQLAIYRIVQEGLRNVQRHADASTIEVRLHRRQAQVELQIIDDGIGFDRQDPDWRAGVGLASMEERARLLGGHCAIESTPGRGTNISVELPLKEDHVEAESSAG